MAINLGALVTLLVDKYSPDGDELPSGVSGMVVQATPNSNGSIRYVVDFGPEGQWNCEENELSHEGTVQRERPSTRHTPLRSGYMSVQPKKEEKSDDNILSFEEEMALLEGEDNTF
jgi:hypothetical protein